MTVADQRMAAGVVAAPADGIANQATAVASTFQVKRVATIAVAHGMHDSYTAFLAPLLPLFKQTLMLSNTEAGLLSVFMSEASLVQPLIGRVADRFSARYFVILAPAVTAIAMSLLGVAPNYLVLAVLLTIAGFSSACMHAVGPVMVGNAAGKRLGTALSIWMVGGEAGRFVGPLVIGVAVPLLTMRRMPLLMFGGLLAAAMLLLSLKEQRGYGQRVVGTGRSLRQELAGKGKLMVVLVGFIIVHVFMSAALVTYLPTLLYDEGESFWLASISLSVLQAAGVVGAMFGGTLSDRLGRRRMLLATVLPTTLFMFIFLGTAGWSRFPVLLVLGLTSLAITPVVMALVQESFPENRALANGFYMAFSFVVRSLVVILLGWLGDLFGLRLAFTISAIVPLLGLPLLLLLPEKRAGG